MASVSSVDMHPSRRRGDCREPLRAYRASRTGRAGGHWPAQCATRCARCRPFAGVRRRCGAADRRMRTELGNGGMALCRRLLRPQRIAEPVSQQAAAAGRGAAIEQRQQGRRAVSAQRGGDLQVAAGRCVESRDDRRPARHAATARAPARPVACLARSAGAHRPPRRRAARPAAPKAERSRVPNCSHSLRVAASASNCHGGNARAGTPSRRGVRLAIRIDEFARCNAVEQGGEFGKLHIGDRETAPARSSHATPARCPDTCTDDQQAFALGIEHAGVGDRARRDDRASPCARQGPWRSRDRRSVRRWRPIRRAGSASRDTARPHDRARPPWGSVCPRMRRAKSA